MAAVTIALGIAGGVGGRHVPARGDVVLVEHAGHVSSIDPASGALTRLGTGCAEPEDTGEPVGQGQVVLVVESESGATEELTVALPLDGDGRSRLHLQRLLRGEGAGAPAQQAEHLGAFGFADSRSRRLVVHP